MPADVIPVRIARGRRRHALPQSGEFETRSRTLCGRDATRSVVDDAFPDCKRCLIVIARTGADVVR